MACRKSAPYGNAERSPRVPLPAGTDALVAEIPLAVRRGRILPLRPARRPAARGGLVALLATLPLVFLTPSLGQAQTVAVSNLGQTSRTALILDDKSYAQSFTTGSHSAGYLLTDIRLDFVLGTSAVSDLVVDLRPANGSNPDTAANKIADLTVPGTLGIGVHGFSAPANTVLDANTTYFVYIRFGSTANRPQVGRANSNAEDSGGLSGWSIGDNRHQYDGSSWATAGNEIKIAVRAEEKTSPPGAPTGLTVTEGHHAVKLDWTAPASDGGSAITEYEVGVQVLGSWISYGDRPTGTSFIDAGTLEDGTYNYRVRAINANGNGAWSDVLTGVEIGLATVTIDGDGDNTEGFPAEFTLTTTKPVLSSSKPLNVSVLVSESEDMVASTEEGTKTVDFAEGDTTAMLSVPTVDDGATESNSVVTAAIQTNADYTVGTDSSATVTITDTGVLVTAPGAPTNLSATANGLNQIDLTWTAPSNDGGEAVGGYRIEVSPDGSSWSDRVTNTGNASAAYSHTGLSPGTTRHYRVSAINSGGVGNRSNVDSATTASTGNTAPTFSASTFTRSVDENSPAGTDVGNAVTATDADNDPLVYTLEGTDAASFAIARTSGQIRTRSGVTYDREAKASYAVIVKADDGNGGSGTAAVTINLTDVNEPPRAPAAPRVTATPNTTDSLTVSWRAPSNTGRPAIDEYDLQYREGATGSWTDGPQGVSGTSTAITGLTAALTAYQVQVRATNADGAGDWSPPGRIRTTPPPPPVSPPSPPRDLTATAGDQAVQLSWRRPADDGGARIVRYEYRQREGDGPVGAWEIIWEEPPPTDHTVTGLTNGVSYTFEVRAVNNGGWASPPSEPASATPEPELEPFEVEIVGVPEVAVAGESYELTAQSDAEEALVYAWQVAWGGTIEPDDAQMVVWTAPETAVTVWIRVDATRVEDGATAGDSVYQRVVEPADLVVASLSVSASGPAAGAPFTLSATVRNAGDGAASATTLRYYQSTDATITTADTAVGTSAVATLAAAGTRAASIDLTAPAAAGTYYYGACVDAVAEEADPTNNCSTAAAVTVPEPVPALPLLGQLLLALGLGAAGARVTRSRQARRRR